MGTLYLVATPIGNLEDITLRALRVLREVRIIAAEDTRQTARLLRHYGITTHAISYHEFNKLSRLDEILAHLAEGDVALVSDAGTPGLNDPGYELVKAALDAGYRVSPLPGPSAPLAALVGSGLATDAFLYQGYLPRKGSERRKRLAEIANLPYTLVFLEVPHRLLDALEDLHTALGDRRAVAARELTKLYEEFVRGTLSELCAHFRANPPRGEFCLVVEGAAPGGAAWAKEKLVEALRERLASGEESPGSLAAELAERSGWRKSDVYRILVHLKESKI